MKKRQIKLTSLEEELLRDRKKNSPSERERDRAHALILSNKGNSIEDLSTIFEVRRATVGEWFDRWEKVGINGLVDAPKEGRPSIFTDLEQKKL